MHTHSFSSMLSSFTDFNNASRIEQFIDRAGELTIDTSFQRENDILKSQREKLLQRENDILKSQREKLLQRENDNSKSRRVLIANDKIKSLQRELTDMQEQLDDITRVRDRLRIELSDVRSQLNAAKHDNSLLITQYDNLSKKYSALAIEVNNNRKRVHEIESPKQHHDVKHKSKKKKKKRKGIIIEKKLTDEEELELEKQRKRDFLEQLEKQELHERLRKIFASRNT